MIAGFDDPIAGLDPAALSDFARVLAAPGPAERMKIEIEPEDVKKGLGKLVLTVVELLRDLLERQAIRRMEAGSLTDDEVERLGTTFLHLSEQMEMLKGAFGIDGEELNIDLGPLGKLL
ncbi:gas vesicle protein K (plasmid) [Tundrisphaera lichenicola]|uniref:gas vesicle protein K n=1 Tax=Tundrisphaera lichenicola TaxID=2029860 RepID=UPI003EBBAA35